jgi:hypothetical protein
MDHHSLRVLEAETIKRSDDFIEPTPIFEEKKKNNSRSKNQAVKYALEFQHYTCFSSKIPRK